MSNAAAVRLHVETAALSGDVVYACQNADTAADCELGDSASTDSVPRDRGPADCGPWCDCEHRRSVTVPLTVTLAFSRAQSAAAPGSAPNADHTNSTTSSSSAPGGNAANAVQTVWVPLALSLTLALRPPRALPPLRAAAADASVEFELALTSVGRVTTTATTTASATATATAGGGAGRATAGDAGSACAGANGAPEPSVVMPSSSLPTAASCYGGGSNETCAGLDAAAAAAAAVDQGRGRDRRRDRTPGAVRAVTQSRSRSRPRSRSPSQTRRLASAATATAVAAAALPALAPSVTAGSGWGFGAIFAPVRSFASAAAALVSAVAVPSFDAESKPPPAEVKPGSTAPRSRSNSRTRTRSRSCSRAVPREGCGTGVWLGPVTLLRSVEATALATAFLSYPQSATNCHSNNASTAGGSATAPAPTPAPSAAAVLLFASVTPPLSNGDEARAADAAAAAAARAPHGLLVLPPALLPLPPRTALAVAPAVALPPALALAVASARSACPPAVRAAAAAHAAAAAIAALGRVPTAAAALLAALSQQAGAGTETEMGTESGIVTVRYAVPVCCRRRRHRAAPARTSLQLPRAFLAAHLPGASASVDADSIADVVSSSSPPLLPLPAAYAHAAPYALHRAATALSLLDAAAGAQWVKSASARNDAARARAAKQPGGAASLPAAGAAVWGAPAPTDIVLASTRTHTCADTAAAADAPLDVVPGLRADSVVTSFRLLPEGCDAATGPGAGATASSGSSAVPAAGWVPPHGGDCEQGGPATVALGWGAWRRPCGNSDTGARGGGAERAEQQWRERVGVCATGAAVVPTSAESADFATDATADAEDTTEEVEVWVLRGGLTLSCDGQTVRISLAQHSWECGSQSSTLAWFANNAFTATFTLVPPNSALAVACVAVTPNTAKPAIAAPTLTIAHRSSARRAPMPATVATTLTGVLSSATLSLHDSKDSGHTAATSSLAVDCDWATLVRSTALPALMTVLHTTLSALPARVLTGILAAASALQRAQPQLHESASCLWVESRLQFTPAHTASHAESSERRSISGIEIKLRGYARARDSDDNNDSSTGGWTLNLAPLLRVYAADADISVSLTLSEPSTQTQTAVLHCYLAALHGADIAIGPYPHVSTAVTDGTSNLSARFAMPYHMCQMLTIMTPAATLPLALGASGCGFRATAAPLLAMRRGVLRLRPRWPGADADAECIASQPPPTVAELAALRSKLSNASNASSVNATPASAAAVIGAFSVSAVSAPNAVPVSPLPPAVAAAAAAGGRGFIVLGMEWVRQCLSTVDRAIIATLTNRDHSGATSVAVELDRLCINGYPADVMPTLTAAAPAPAAATAARRKPTGASDPLQLAPAQLPWALFRYPAAFLPPRVAVPSAATALSGAAGASLSPPGLSSPMSPTAADAGAEPGPAASPSTATPSPLLSPSPLALSTASSLSSPVALLDAAATPNGKPNAAKLTKPGTGAARATGTKPGAKPTAPAKAWLTAPLPRLSAAAQRLRLRFWAQLVTDLARFTPLAVPTAWSATWAFEHHLHATLARSPLAPLLFAGSGASAGGAKGAPEIWPVIAVKGVDCTLTATPVADFNAANTGAETASNVDWAQESDVAMRWDALHGMVLYFADDSKHDLKVKPHALNPPALAAAAAAAAERGQPGELGRSGFDIVFSFPNAPAINPCDSTSVSSGPSFCEIGLRGATAQLTVGAVAAPALPSSQPSSTPTSPVPTTGGLPPYGPAFARRLQMASGPAADMLGDGTNDTVLFVSPL